MTLPLKGAAEIASQIATEFALQPVVGLECEFYVESDARLTIDSQLFQETCTAARAQGIALHKLEAERGRNQFEFSLRHTANIPGLLLHYREFSAILGAQAGEAGYKVNFAAKPYSVEPGSGLHVHVHLQNTEGKNVFYKDDETISEPLARSIAGLLNTMRQYRSVFVPGDASKARFTPGSNAPLTVSWGANNRTVAIRLPDKPHANKHIEHRVAGADADVECVVAAVLDGIRTGLALEHYQLPPQVYGDASLDIYGLEKLFP